MNKIRNDYGEWVVSVNAMKECIKPEKESDPIREMEEWEAGVLESDGYDC